MQQRQHKPETAAASPHLLRAATFCRGFLSPHSHSFPCLPCQHQSPSEELLSGLCRTPESPGSGSAAPPDLGEQFLHLSWLVQHQCNLSQRAGAKEGPCSSAKRPKEKDRSDSLRRLWGDNRIPDRFSQQPKPLEEPPRTCQARALQVFLHILLPARKQHSLPAPSTLEGPTS